MVGEMVGMIQRIILGFVLAGLAGTSFAQDGRGKDSDSQPPGSSEEPRGEQDPPEPLPPYEPGSTIVVRVRRDAEPEPPPPTGGSVDESAKGGTSVPDTKKYLKALRRIKKRYKALHPPSPRKTPDFQPSEDGVRERTRQKMEERLREAELTRPRTKVGVNPCAGRAASVPAPQPCSRVMKQADPPVPAEPVPAPVEVNPCAGEQQNGNGITPSAPRQPLGQRPVPYYYSQ